MLTTEKDIFSKMIRDRIEKEAAQTGPEPGTEKEAITGPKKIILRKHFSDHPGTENRTEKKVSIE